MTGLPLVSIVMPCFNSAKYLNSAVHSVLDQSFKNWELMICDDGSDDGSVQIAEEWAKNHRQIFFLRNRFEKGASGARNTCLSEARGRYIAFLDSDDEWLPKKLEQQLRFIAETNAPFVFGYCENISEQGNLLSTTKAPESVSLQKLFISNFIPCLTVIYDTKIFGKVEQPYIKKRNDYALWLRMLSENRDIGARCYPQVVARYRVNNYGLSASKVSAIEYFYRCLRQFAGLGLLTACSFTFLAVILKTLKTSSPQAYNLVVTKIL